jgi:hypothetical protein
LLDENGDIRLTNLGRYITESDWIEDPVVISENPDPEAPPVRICRHDMSIREPENPVYERRLVDKSHVIYSGPCAKGVHYRDFLCPLTASSVHEADFIGYIYEMGLHEAASQFGRPDMSTPKKNKSAVGKFWDALRDSIEILRAQDHDDPKSMEKDTDVFRGEGLRDSNKSGAIPPIQIMECYFRADVHEDGIAREIVMILAIPEEGSRDVELLYMNYTGACFPMGRRPFEVITRRKVPGRWYGEGTYEEYYDQDLFIDTQLNRIVYRSLVSKTPIVVDYSVVNEKTDPLDLSGDKKVYTAKQGENTENFIRRFDLFERIEEAETLSTMMTQSLQLEIGAMSEADAAMADLPSSDTATGARINQGITDVLTAEEIAYLAEGQNDLLRAFVRCYLHGIAVNDRTEFYQYTKGREQQIGVISKEDVASLDVRVRLLLTRRHNQTIYERTSQGTELFSQYINDIALARQMGIADEAFLPGLRELYIQRGKALELEEVESIFPDLTNQGAMPGAPEGGGQQQAPVADGLDVPEL